MALLSTQTVDVDGQVITLAAAAGGGDTFNPGNGVSLRVKNGDASAKTVTVESHVPCNQGGTHNLVVVVAAGDTVDIGPLPASRFGDAAGVGHITYSAVTSVTIAAVRTGAGG